MTEQMPEIEVETPKKKTKAAPKKADTTSKARANALAKLKAAGR